ncbi:hypothetical protein PVAND_002122 [Polypedilum vanderplanki]|uniref:Epimerase family protein SDR39U1 n=1 Tax=Polypedilum vanderplanki TaxID=319348 RepID=A0A9J6BQ13_POLVA|nr:hypothetical protein PVAND_002122 [Polypedilum vanderplanki]
MKRVLIGGGSGFIGTRLSNHLKNCGYGVTIISRKPQLNHISWIEIEKNGLREPFNAVVNLCGQNVLDPTRRWSPGFKLNVWNSRINSSKTLVKAISEAKSEIRPEVFINISGVSNYKPDDKKVYTENDNLESYDYMSELCNAWEKAATIDKLTTGCRNVKLRTGVVLGREGGMIASLFVPFFMGFGGPVGDGNQPLPWIHVEDLCELIRFSIENKNVEGVLNAVAPQIIKNKDFAQAFGRALWRPAFIPLPSQAVEFMFSKERAVLLTTGAKIKPLRTLETGFQYQYPTINEALKDCAKLFMF